MGKNHKKNFFFRKKKKKTIINFITPYDYKKNTSTTPHKYIRSHSIFLLLIPNPKLFYN